ncbi:hypothetical protein AB1Y20_022869 [Prymnesium parvum]|uniref:Uncharacterized protein n=1 Tax=Prymnesium parvum TaxID=97485 RepID=A0AB34JE18_PRYPA|mmetsp:Transcript_19194/g.47964  ORF Transcript_19194/g.47964 Transcript_19194/m.47964 type:complete len:228 (+) Transcript_19194:222-905(+)
MRSMAGAGAPTGPLDANELEEVPSGKGYESLDEDDAPPRGNQLLEDEELVGLEEYAPEQEPSVDAGEVQAAAPIQPLQVKFALPPGAQPGAKLSIKVPDGRMLAFTVPVNAQPGMEFKLQYQPLLAPPATAALYNFIKEIDPSWMTKRFVEATLPTLVELLCAAADSAMLGGLWLKPLARDWVTKRSRSRGERSGSSPAPLSGRSGGWRSAMVRTILYILLFFKLAN